MPSPQMMMIERDVKRMQGVNDITCLKGLLDIRVSRNVKKRKEAAIQHVTTKKWQYAVSLRR